MEACSSVCSLNPSLSLKNSCLHQGHLCIIYEGKNKEITIIYYVCTIFTLIRNIPAGVVSHQFIFSVHHDKPCQNNLYNTVPGEDLNYYLIQTLNPEREIMELSAYVNSEASDKTV